MMTMMIREISRFDVAPVEMVWHQSATAETLAPQGFEACFLLPWHRGTENTAYIRACVWV